MHQQSTSKKHQIQQPKQPKQHVKHSQRNQTYVIPNRQKQANTKS